jgi:hypothetical protein
MISVFRADTKNVLPTDTTNIFVVVIGRWNVLSRLRCTFVVDGEDESWECHA